MKGKEELLLHPEPGSKAAAARDFGIDLTLIIERLRLTPEERLRLMDGIKDSLRHIKTHGRFLRANERY
jgi:hypothetical protein